MSDGPSNSPENAPEIPRNAVVYEHLFPGNTWDTLPKFNPLNAPRLFGRVMYGCGKRADDFESAVRRRDGYAGRYDLVHPDKLSVGFELLSVDPVDEMPQKGWFSDHLKEGETIGGMGITPVGVIREEYRYRRVTGTIGKSAEDVYNFHMMKIVGILGEDGKPRAVIAYKEGPRERKAVKKEVSVAPAEFALETAKIRRN